MGGWECGPFVMRDCSSSARAVWLCNRWFSCVFSACRRLVSLLAVVWVLPMLSFSSTRSSLYTSVRFLSTRSSLYDNVRFVSTRSSLYDNVRFVSTRSSFYYSVRFLSTRSLLYDNVRFVSVQADRFENCCWGRSK